MTPAMPFIALLRRASHSGYKSMVMNNRMLIQCFDITIDSDNGLHYVLYIPDSEAYDDPFYDSYLILDPSTVLNTFNKGHKELEEKRKQLKAKPKEASEEFILHIKNGHGEIKFLYYLQGELLTTAACRVQYPVDETSRTIINIEETFNNLADRIKPGGICLKFDGLRLGLQEKAMNSSEIYFYVVKCGDRKIKIPLTRSSFMGIKEVDQFVFTVQESLIPHIFVYSYQIKKKGILEQRFGYVLEF